MPAIQMNPSFSQYAGQALQQTLANFAQEQQQKEQQSKLNNALMQAQQIERSNLSPQEKLFEQSRLLSGFPEIMKQIQEQQYRNRSLELEQQKINQPKAAATNKFSPLPPEQVKLVNQFLNDPKYKDLPDEEWKAAGEELGINPSEMEALTKTRQARKAKERGEYESDRAFHTKESEETLKQARELRTATVLKENGIREMEDSIVEGNLAVGSDYLADITGWEGFRTAKGAKFISANKEYFLHNIRRAGARPNMWIEQQIASMSPKVGRSREGNLSQLELMKFENDFDKKWLEEVDRISQADRKKYGYVKGDVDQRVGDAMKPWIEQRQNQMAYNLRQIEEIEMPLEKLEKFSKVRKGTPLTVNMARILLNKYGTDEKAQAEAEKLGYTIYPGT